MDLKITEDDGWFEIYPHPRQSRNLWVAYVEGNNRAVVGELYKQGYTIYPADGNEEYNGEIEFMLLAQPAELKESVWRMWVRAPVDLDVEYD